MTDPSRAEALAAVLGSALPVPVTVVSERRLSGGASAELSAVDVVDASGAAHDLVLRRSPRATSGAMTAGVAVEAAAIRAAGVAGVPVPTVVASFADDPVLGDGYLMSRLDGEALPGRLLRDVEYDAMRPGLLGQVAVALAGIHAASPDGVGAARLSAADQLDGLEALHRSFGKVVPTFDRALDWLRARLPDGTPEVLVHGDFRMGNLLCDGTGLVAVLDWELVHLGDSHEDLGWFCAPAWRFGGAGPAGGLGPREELYAAYTAASGRRVDHERARFWEVLGTLKWGVICQLQASRVLAHGERSVEHALIGRRVTEVELDLLLLTEDGDLPPLVPDGVVAVEPAIVAVGTHPTAEQLWELATETLAANSVADPTSSPTDRQRFLVRVARRALEVVERERALGRRVAALESTGHLAASVLGRLAIDNPAYPSLAEARTRWPELTAAVDSALGS